MKKELVIEWKHIGKDVENTCERCEETGLTLAAVLAEIRTLLEMEGVSVRMVETVLPDAAVAESNSLLFNGVPIEDLLEGVEVTTTPCCSCSCITCDEDTECRALRYNGEEYEAIPPELIGRAAMKALGME
ncbi:DUF2703 domain-containing protein [Methanoculleus sp. UBA303]|jgi:hypothetical protein|uniref:DUF2703 domain-containing protein n=1 Tax=Methanoculleus sp. UBA303 TaxID=1915497 RepID=UPI0025CF2CCC|nr:DUF2703 domain-containing protein [Methanoculleus sp. UBA303]MCK9276960.1 DUF2703 domain-containing protein [Methanoculleus sp.]MDD3934536.1 DUF2703 domain-containing protein [Methanoculleus sp.]